MALSGRRSRFVGWTTVDWGQLQGELAASGAQVADLLRAFPSGSLPVPGLKWSVGELGAHLVSVPRRYGRMLETPEPLPESLSAVNDDEIRAVGSTDPQQLAESLVSEVAELVRVLGDDGDRAVPFFGMRHTVQGMGGVMLGELLLHGLDLAGPLRRPWPIRRDQAIAVTRGLLPSVGYSIDRKVAAKATGTYHVYLRGGDDWIIEVRDARVDIERRRPTRADLHVSAEPVAFLLVGYGRMSHWRALMLARMIAWGRKPWLTVPFAKLFAET